MALGAATEHASRILTHAGVAELIQQLKAQDRRVLGPRLVNGVIDYAEIDGLTDLPVGLTEHQAAGSYRLEHTQSSRLFGFSTTASSLKRHFHPPKQKLFSLRRSEAGPVLTPAAPAQQPLAVIGARGCDLHGLSVLDAVLGQGAHSDAAYVTRRADVFIVAVQCSVAGGSCFCASMGTGPEVHHGYDIALTELEDELLLATAGTERGEALLSRVAGELATQEHIEEASSVVEQTKGLLSKHVNTQELPQLLQNNLESPVWDAVAERCLACANCTMSCPTCFCSNTEEHNTWEGEVSRNLVWDSCFTTDYSYVHGGAVRPTTKAKYRQWLTHKFSTWFDQFGSSGCVGCGRCITWCPVGIDVTQELSAIRQTDSASKTTKDNKGGAG